MCIQNSVGRGGANQTDDVKIVQVLLNINLERLTPPAEPVAEDGAMGQETLSAIGAFQTQVVNLPAPTQLIRPGDETLRKLQSGMPAGLNAAKLRAIMLSADEHTVARYAQALVVCLSSSPINSPLRAAHFLAQIGHESLDLRFAEELSDGSQYEGRVDLGNTQPGDGPRFKGRGLIQLTGRANYTAYGQARHRDFVTPQNYLQIATDPALAVDVAVWFWEKHGLDALADADDVTQITRRINGGLNGLADRTLRLARTKFFLVPAEMVQPTHAGI